MGDRTETDLEKLTAALDLAREEVQQQRKQLDSVGTPGAYGEGALTRERVRQAGGAIREETVEENAARLERELQEEKERAYFLLSENGIQAAGETVGQLFAGLEQLAARAGFSFSSARDGVAMYRDGFTVEVWWSRPYINTLNESALHVREWEGRPDFGEHRYARTRQPTELRARQFEFDILPGGDTGWREIRTRQLYSSGRLASHCANLLLEHVRRKRLNDR